MDRTTTGRAIQPLERLKLATGGAGSDPHPNRMRRRPAGAKRLKAAAPRWREAQQEFERDYGSDEAAALRTALARVSTIG